MAIPAEATSNMVAPHGLVAGDNVLDSAGENVTVVRKTGSKRRTIVKDVLREGFSAGQLGLKGFDFRPERKDLFLMAGERKFLPFADFLH